MVVLPSAYPLSSTHTVLSCRRSFLPQHNRGKASYERRSSCQHILCSIGPESVPVHTISLLDAQKKAHNNLSPSELRKVWDNTGKPLLRVGKAGVQASHKRSLQELLLAHNAVKVQINQSEQSEVEDSGQQLADYSKAQLLQVKGRTALFVAEGKGRKELLPARATVSALHSEQQSDPGASRPIQLAPDVQTQLQHLRYSGALGLHEPDSQCIKVLSQLPPTSAVQLLSINRLRRVVNKSAWLTSQCRRQLGQESKQTA